jgi:hypothetical protein
MVLDSANDRVGSCMGAFKGWWVIPSSLSNYSTFSEGCIVDARGNLPSWIIMKRRVGYTFSHRNLKLLTRILETMIYE